MRFLNRNIPIADIFLHLILVGLVITSYTYLLYASFVLPVPTYSDQVKNAFGHIVAPWPVFPGMGDIQFCYYGDRSTGFVSQDERGTWCQINFDQFTGMCKLFGLFMSDAERRLFFDTLDITGNGMLSWGEIGTRIFINATFEDHLSADTVFIYYAKRWKHMKGLGIGGGLNRIEGFDYEPYRIDYTSWIWGLLGIWGPRGAYEDFLDHSYYFRENHTSYW